MKYLQHFNRKDMKENSTKLKTTSDQELVTPRLLLGQYSFTIFCRIFESFFVLISVLLLLRKIVKSVAIKLRKFNSSTQHHIITIKNGKKFYTVIDYWPNCFKKIESSDNF